MVILTGDMATDHSARLPSSADENTTSSELQESRVTARPVEGPSRQRPVEGPTRPEPMPVQGPTRLDQGLQVLLMVSLFLNLVWLSGETSTLLNTVGIKGTGTMETQPQPQQQQKDMTPLTDSALQVWTTHTANGTNGLNKAFGLHVDNVKFLRPHVPSPKPPPELTEEEITSKLVIAGRHCETESLRTLVKYLHNVVLIININYDSVAKKTAGFLRQVYGRFFDHVVIVGPNALPEFGVEARGPPGMRRLWHYAFHYLPAIVARYPNAEGYLWTNDDVVINYWNLIDANKSKLWLPDTPECNRCRHFIPFKGNLPRGTEDDRWSSRVRTRNEAHAALSASDTKFIDQYRESLRPRKDGFMKQVPDCFYVPQRLAPALCGDLIPIYRHHKVPSEIAIPMMFYSVEHPKEYDGIFRRMVYQWARHPSYDPRQYWNQTLGAYHHWKLAKDHLRRGFLEAFSARDVCVRHLIDDPGF